MLTQRERDSYSFWFRVMGRANPSDEEMERLPVRIQLAILSLIVVALLGAIGYSLITRLFR